MSTLANEHRAINLSQGFPDFSSSPKLIELVHYYMEKGMNQYAPMPGVMRLREQIAEKNRLLYGLNLSPENEITIAAGATQALFTAISAFVQTGDEVIVIEPAFDTYTPTIRLNGAIPVPYQLSAPDYAINWSEFEQLISSKTRMIIINSPHNPTGSILKKEDLEALNLICRNTDIVVLSDEVYEHLIFDGLKHQSVLSYPELYQRSLVCFSFGKTFHNTGWKVGYCIAPPEMTVEFRKVHQFNVFSVNHPVQHALAEFLEDPEEYLSLASFFQQKRDFFLESMEACKLQALPALGTYFQLFDYSSISNEGDQEFCKRLTREYGVAAIPVSVFNTSGKDERIIRFCFAKKEKTLAKAAALLQKL